MKTGCLIVLDIPAFIVLIIKWFYVQFAHMNLTALSKWSV